MRKFRGNSTAARANRVLETVTKMHCHQDGGIEKCQLAWWVPSADPDVGQFHEFRATTNSRNVDKLVYRNWAAFPELYDHLVSDAWRTYHNKEMYITR